VVGEARVVLGCAALEVVNAGIFLLLALVFDSDRLVKRHIVESRLSICGGNRIE
jgi:hypothetical protein